MALESDGHLVERFRTIMFLPLVVPSPSDGGGGMKFRQDQTQHLLHTLKQVSGDGKPWREVADKLSHLDTCVGQDVASPPKPGQTCDRRAATDSDPTAADAALKAATGSAEDITFPQRMKYQEFVYFHGFIQKLLFSRHAGREGDADNDLRIFQRTDIRQIRITTAPAASGDPPPFKVTLTCDRFNLYVFPIGIAILCVELSGGQTGVVENTRTSLTHVLAIQNVIRRIYPPYFALKGDALELREFPAHIEFIDCKGKVFVEDKMLPGEWMARVTDQKGDPADPRCNPMSNAWRHVLRPLCIEGDTAAAAPAWRQVVDERMPCMTFISCPTAGKLSDALWLRLVYMDQPGNGFAYNRKFEPDWKKRYCYDRHWYGEYGTRYLISSYSFLCVGDPCEDLFPKTIEQHFRRMYADMMLLNQFQFAALLALSNWISDAVPEPAQAERKRQHLRNEVKELRAIYVSFVQRFWFTNVSNQIQARELYAKIRDHIGTETLYEEVSRQLADVNEYLEAEEQADQSDAALKLNVLAGVGLGASVPLSALALLGDKVSWFGKFNSEAALGGRPASWLLDSSVIVVSIGLAYLLLGWLLSVMVMGERGRATRRFISLLRKLGGILMAVAVVLFTLGLIVHHP